jgi:hypothetical protein
VKSASIGSHRRCHRPVRAHGEDPRHADRCIASRADLQSCVQCRWRCSSSRLMNCHPNAAVPTAQAERSARRPARGAGSIRRLGDRVLRANVSSPAFLRQPEQRSEPTNFGREADLAASMGSRADGRSVVGTSITAEAAFQPTRALWLPRFARRANHARRRKPSVRPSD